jgi:hypothetical protein
MTTYRIISTERLSHKTSHVGEDTTDMTHAINEAAAINSFSSTYNRVEVWEMTDYTICATNTAHPDLETAIDLNTWQGRN